MKKILCYLGIIILLCLTLLPPVLRIMLPDKDQVKEEIVIKNQILSCEGERFITKTIYDNTKIQMIVIKRLNPVSSNVENEDTSSVLTSELDIIIDSLKNESGVTYNILEDGDVLGIDFSLDDHSKLNISKINQDINLQKNYYESKNLTCLVIEQ